MAEAPISHQVLRKIDAAMHALDSCLMSVDTVLDYDAGNESRAEIAAAMDALARVFRRVSDVEKTENNPAPYRFRAA